MGKQNQILHNRKEKGFKNITRILQDVNNVMLLCPMKNDIINFALNHVIMILEELEKENVCFVIQVLMAKEIINTVVTDAKKILSGMK